MKEDDLVSIRNILCVWAQIRDFIAGKLPSFDELEQALSTGSAKDFEFREIMEQRPSSFALSMLPSCQNLQLEKVKVQEEKINMQVEKERMKVREARWEYFQAALERDQSQLKQVAPAPQKLEAMKHRKQVAWRMSQAKQGEKVVKSFMEKYVRCDLVEKVEHAQQKVNEFRSLYCSLAFAGGFCFLLFSGNWVEKHVF